MTTQHQSPYNELPYTPARLRMPRPAYVPMTDTRRAMLAAYVETRQWLAGVSPKPMVVNQDAVSMWERETIQS